MVVINAVIIIIYRLRLEADGLSYKLILPHSVIFIFLVKELKHIKLSFY
jgi:hypothetical protein